MEFNNNLPEITYVNIIVLRIDSNVVKSTIDDYSNIYITLSHSMLW